MKTIRFAALVLCVFSVIWMAGCEVVPTDPPATPTPSSVPIEQPIDPADITIDVPAEESWTWNDLYDYLENPVRSGDLSFDEAAGEYLVLYDTDWQTVLKNGNLLLRQDMMAIRYAADDTILCRYYVNLMRDDSPSTASSADASVPEPVASNPASGAEPSSVPPTAPVSSGTSQPSPATSIPADPHEVSASMPEDPVTSLPQPAAKTVITIYAPVSDTALTSAIDAFNRQSGSVTVQQVDIADAVTAGNLQWMLSQGERPDLVLMERADMTVAVSAGLLTNLSTLGADRLEPLFHPVCWQRSTVNGGQYGLPVGCVTACLACNQEILYQCDVDLPDDYRTLVEYARVIRDTLPEAVPIGITANRSNIRGLAQPFVCALWSYGGNLLSPDNRHADFDSDDGLAALTDWQTLWEEELLSPSYQPSQLYAGKVAYAPVECTAYESVFGRYAKVNYAATPLPLPGGGGGSRLTLYDYCLPTGGTPEQVAAAYAFLSFYMNDPAYSLGTCQKEGWIPALNAARENRVYQTEAWQVLIAAVDTARVTPPVDCYDTIEGYLAEMAASVMAGEDPARALETAAQKTNNRLAR